MACTLRPSLLRQALAPAVSRHINTAASTSSAIPAFARSSRLVAPRRPIFALQRAATFHTSTARAILPPLPQKVEGTVNDAAPVHDPHPMHGSYHWTTERIISAALIPISIAPFAAGSLSPLLDGSLIALIILHSYIGFQSIITDYLPKWRVPFTRNLFEWTNLLAVFVVGWGYYEFETNDVGLTEGIRRIWKAGSVKEGTA